MQVYLVDSKWMQEFKRIFYPHWLHPDVTYSTTPPPTPPVHPQNQSKTPTGLELRDEPETGALQVSKSSQSEFHSLESQSLKSSEVSSRSEILLKR